MIILRLGITTVTRFRKLIGLCTTLLLLSSCNNNPHTTTTSSSTTSTSVTTTTMNSAILPQTTLKPSSNSVQFNTEIRHLWQGIQNGSTKEARVSFFPRQAYVKLKAISDPNYDYTHRLIDHFRLDLMAAHALLGPNPKTANLLYVKVPSYYATWIKPGICYNKIGYWHVPGSRLVYEQNHQIRSIGIASLISWRGQWYVVHLGAVSRTTDVGIIDAPSIGPGVVGPPGGC